MKCPWLCTDCWQLAYFGHECSGKGWPLYLILILLLPVVAGAECYDIKTHKEIPCPFVDERTHLQANAISTPTISDKEIVQKGLCPSGWKKARNGKDGSREFFLFTSRIKGNEYGQGIFPVEYCPENGLLRIRP